MNNATETMSIFGQAFALRLARVREEFDRRKKNFLEAASISPANAVRIAQAVVEAQHELSAWLYAEKLIASKSMEHGAKYAVESAVEALKQHLILRATEGQSTSALTNGVTHAEIVGTRNAIDELQYLADHPA